MLKRKIIFALALGMVMLCSCGKSKDESETDVTTAAETTTAVSDSSEETQTQAARSYAPNETVTGPATVSFLDGKGNILRSEECGDGERAEMKSPESAPDSVFMKWNKADDSVHTDDAIAFSAVTKSLEGVSNAITYDTVYVGSDERSVNVPVRLCGEVKAVLLQLKICYDKEILDFDRFVSTDGGVVCNCDEETGTILLSLTDAEDITAAVDLCDIAFNVIKRESTTLNITVMDIAAVGADDTPFIDVPFKVLHGDILF